MKHLLRLLLILSPILGMAQESVVTISAAQFDKATDRLSLGDYDGWLFKQGNDTAWSKTTNNISGWRKLKPADLSAKYADKSGRVEGWFRIKIRADKTLKKLPLGLRWTSWAAADIYINGTLFSSFGNTGRNGKPYAENQVLVSNGQLIGSFKTGADYVIAVHFVDYLSPFPPRYLKSEISRSKFTLALTGPKCNALLTNLVTKINLYFAIWLSICTILSLLFWLLAIQNPAEKEFRLIAISSTFFALSTFFSMRITFTNLSFTSYFFSVYALNLFAELIFISLPIIFANIFKRAISRKFMALLFVILLYNVISNFLPASGLIPEGIADLFLIVVCIYYVASAWRRLRGAQWCIIAGLLSSVVFLILLIILNIVSLVNISPDVSFFLLTGFLLSFPMSLLVYVAMRFREIIEEVRLNAQQVVTLSEEKREQAINRQKILQEEVDRQTLEIRSALAHLKATQNQLIQSEKMASLGELTAGIAHEIQNPLNFVNNFSEVSAELVDEMGDELDKGDIGEAKAIGADLKQNLEKINHHGKRADAIVKGMLEHSRAGSGTKEPTDINKLADEYLRLSYHGLRSKDKSFNAVPITIGMVTHLDDKLPLINVIPQDIGRVLLNLFNNAFYAVNQKVKIVGPDYKPEVTVTTSLENGKVIILVKDNGTGIPDSIKEKIMQPFFTTKPTGEGTGLGLSLTYDMVVKGYGGSIQVNSVEGEGSEFVVILPP